MRNSHKKLKKTGNNIIYTPKPIVLKMIEMCNIKENDKVLDPSKGAGVFYDNLPINCIKSYCEITEGIDFFNDNNRYDLIIGNPPFSLWTKWIEHTIKLTDKFCYIMNVFNLTDSRIRTIFNNGYGITKIHLLKVGWWMGHQYLILFEKNKPSIMTVEEKIIICDICNSRCNRGKAGKDMNKCTKNNEEIINI